LYRIATNACIDFIRKRAPRSAPVESSDRVLDSQSPWIQPYPDELLDMAGGGVGRPDAVLVARETIELAFLTTVQLLPAKQRAVLILHDVLAFSAVETAELLDDTLAAVNSALQRARSTLRQWRGPASDSSPAPEATFGERLLLRLFMDAQERGDVQAIVELLREDVRMTLFPDGVTWDGREEVACEFFKGQDAFFFKRIDAFGDVRCVGISANRQPAVAVYVRGSNDTAYRACAIVVLGVLDGKLREIATFASPGLFSRFNLAQTLAEPQPTSR
jgi:RNA polymerase sigma-70 factor (ECF subfamily)